MGTPDYTIARIGERAFTDRKVHNPFPDTFLTTESGPSFTFKARHLGGSETIASRIPRLWSVKTAWLWVSSEGPDRLAVTVHFGRPEDRNAPRMGSRGISSRISNNVHIKRYIHVIRQR
jgi:hypothetical protein